VYSHKGGRKTDVQRGKKRAKGEELTPIRQLRGKRVAEQLGVGLPAVAFATFQREEEGVRDEGGKRGRFFLGVKEYCSRKKERSKERKKLINPTSNYGEKDRRTDIFWEKKPGGVTVGEKRPHNDPSPSGK